MSITNLDLVCINCMHEKPDSGVCPYCGFDESQYEPSPHHLPPRSILGGKCLVGRVLGEGGFGITYLGWDLNLDLKLAIKEYYPTGYVTRTNTTTTTVTPFHGEKTEFFSKGRSRFIDEAKTLAKFYTLPGVVSVRDFFLENGTAYIVMEFVEGETLKQRLARLGGKMSAAEVFDLIRPLMRSLSEMHATGLIHRDISPDNIMITPEGNVKLIDFGAARDYLDSGNHSLSVMLKPGYAPEEQYFARGQQGPWTDIYALCATIYRAITGATPPESVERLRHDELQAPSRLGASISPAQEGALLKGLAVSQDDRWQNIPELYAALYPADGRVVEMKQPEKQKKAVDHNAHTDTGSDRKTGWLSTLRKKSAAFFKTFSSPKRLLTIACPLAGLFMIILVIVTVGASAKKKTVTQINDYLEQGDFDSAMVLIQKIDVDDKSYDTALYEAAQNLLKEGDFEHASLITERIVDTNNLDITPLNDEITYQRIQALLDQGDEQAAEPLIENIKNEDQYDKQSLYSDVAAIRIKREFSDLNIVDAIVDLIHLKDTDAERAADLIDSYAEDIYQYGVSQYHENILDESETVFSLLDPEYQRTKDYLLLMQITRIIKLELLDWDWDDKDDPERVLAQELVKIADFENAGEILMTNQKIAVLFFDGGWTGGSKHFFITPRGKRVSTSILDKLDKKNVEYYDQSWNIPGLSSEYCSISKGEFYQRADNRLFTISKKIARFTVIDANTISIYVYSSGTSYTLNRDFPLH